MAKRITIYHDGVWAGEGWIGERGAILGCAAVLGPDDDASEDTYEAIDPETSEWDEAVEAARVAYVTYIRQHG